MKALQIAIEDPQTGANVEIHAISSYNVDLTNKITQAHLAGYVSAKAVAEGKRSVSFRHVSIPGVPDEGEPAQAWIYGRVTQPADDATRAAPGYMPSPFVGAELVEV